MPAKTPPKPQKTPNRGLKKAVKNALEKSRKRFNPTIKHTISISPAHLQTLEELILTPMAKAAEREKKSHAKLRPATKAIQSVMAQTKTEREKFIIECTLRTTAGAELQRRAFKLINKETTGN